MKFSHSLCLNNPVLWQDPGAHFTLNFKRCFIIRYLKSTFRIFRRVSSIRGTFKKSELSEFYCIHVPLLQASFNLNSFLRKHFPLQRLATSVMAWLINVSYHNWEFYRLENARQCVSDISRRPGYMCFIHGRTCRCLQRDVRNECYYTLYDI